MDAHDQRQIAHHRLDGVDLFGENSCVMEWSEIHGFASMAGYVELKRRVDAAVSDGVLVPVPVGQPHDDVGFNEQWYEVPVNATLAFGRAGLPFKGLFEKITD